jgi:hypothetical protein
MGRWIISDHVLVHSEEFTREDNNDNKNSIEEAKNNYRWM